jgi:predicted nuclease of predicted toxin-antitoxin system
VKLLVDQMWPASLAEQLRKRGHDVVAVIERKDLTHAADDTVFETSRREERAVFTENVRDYLPLATDCLGRSQEFFGLVLTSDQTFPRGHSRILGRVVAALDRYLIEHPASDALRNRIDWLPAVDRPA